MVCKQPYCRYGGISGISLLMISILIGTVTTAQKNIEVKSERDRAVEAEKSVRIESSLKTTSHWLKDRQTEVEGSYAKAYALKRAYIDVKEKEYARLKLNDDQVHSDKDIHTCLDWQPRSPVEWILMMGVKSIQ